MRYHPSRHNSRLAGICTIVLSCLIFTLPAFGMEKRDYAQDAADMPLFCFASYLPVTKSSITGTLDALGGDYIISEQDDSSMTLMLNGYIWKYRHIGKTDEFQCDVSPIDHRPSDNQISDITDGMEKSVSYIENFERTESDDTSRLSGLLFPATGGLNNGGYISIIVNHNSSVIPLVSMRLFRKQ